jgi:hypothetical protein
MVDITRDPNLKSIQDAAEQDVLNVPDRALLDEASPVRARFVFARALRANGYDSTGAKLLPNRRRVASSREGGAYGRDDRAEREAPPLRASFGPPSDTTDDEDPEPDLRPRRR